MNVDWFLESIATDGLRLTQAIDKLPFTVGREHDNDLVVEARGVSGHHAQFDRDADDQLRLTDLGSMNGTFVNRERIEAPRRLAENDIIHFGNAEYRLAIRTMVAVAALPQSDDHGMRTLMVPKGVSLSARFVPHERQFMELLRGHGLSAAAQPIVDATRGSIFAYELLGRCTHPDLPASPIQLFHLAARLELEAELSDAFRSYGVAAITPRLKGAKLFVNTHPKETFADDFFAGLKRLREQQNAPDLVVEVHETAVVEVGRMRELKDRLDDIGVRLAYDDFGAIDGPSRLNELGDAPAHFVKFDMALVHDIHQATEQKRRVVRGMVRMVLDLGSVPLAEGVELEAEAAVCREMGFQLIQGYLTGRPASLESI
jgi:EAL domain-containing protein (putative c-di-GMP-specific phosphodiesterase class I)